MSTTMHSKESNFFRYLDIHVSEINDYPGSLQDIYFNRSFEGFIIREAFSRDAMEQVTDRLEKDKGDMSSTFVSSQSKSALIANINHSYGPGLFGSNSDLEGYFAKASAFRNGCRTLFQGNIDYEERIESVLHALSGGLPVSIPTGVEGQAYNSSSIRVIPDGHEIPIHVGKEPLLFPQASHLRTLVDITDQFSFFIPLSLPDAGGELIVYDLEFDEEQSKKNQTSNIYEIGLRTKNLNPDSYKSKVLAPGVGDMLLFDGGRYYHRVTQVSGKRPRRTIGGFANFSHDREALYYWN
jgi:hapalindole-type alkaloid chlorinase